MQLWCDSAIPIYAQNIRHKTEVRYQYRTSTVHGTGTRVMCTYRTWSQCIQTGRVPGTRPVSLPRLGAVGGTRLLPSRHRAKSRPHTHRNSWRERGGAYPALLAGTLAALPESLKPIRRSVAARRFFGGQSCNFDAMHLGQNARLASWALRAPRRAPRVASVVCVLARNSAWRI